MRKHPPLLLALALVAGFSSSVAQAKSKTLECGQLPELFMAYLNNHYMVHSLTDEVKGRTVEQYVQNLDPFRTELLAADVEKLKTQLLAVFDSSKKGDCKSLDPIRDLLTLRGEQDLAEAKKMLDDKYALDTTVEITADPKKRPYSTTPEQRLETLRKMIHFQISNYTIGDMKLPDAKKQLVHRYELNVKKMRERKQGDWVEDFAIAFASALDPHSSFLPQDTLEDFQISMRLSLEGIGVSLRGQDGFTTVEEIIPGGAADKLKILKRKDRIIAVSQDKAPSVSTIDMELPEVVKMIRGARNTKVKLTILRQGDKTETFDVTIVRDRIDVKEQAAKIKYEKRKMGGKTETIGVIDLPSFYGSTDGPGRTASEDIRKLIVEAKKKNTKAIVLDLSRNGGGLLGEAVKISGLFMKKGNVVATQTSGHKAETLADQEEVTDWAGPLVVLTTRLSASASEILAGALKDYHRAVIVGTDHTFGKGSVQTVAPIPDGLGAIKVTTGMFFIPGGQSTQYQGVKSDVVIPPVFSGYELGENFLPYSLPPKAIDAFLSKDANDETPSSHWRPIDDAIIQKLAAASGERVKKSEGFKKAAEELAKAEKSRDVIKVADMQKNKTETNTKRKKKRSEADEETFGPMTDEAVSIAADLAGI